MLMTGVTGIFGGTIFQKLEKFYDLYYLVRDGVYNQKLSLEIDNDKVFSGDITQSLCGLSHSDLKRLEGIGIDKFFHVAANVSFEIDDIDSKINKTNYTGTANVIQLAKDWGVKEFLFCSTAFAEYQRNPYEQSKWAAEGLVKKSGLKYSIFRPSAIVGDSRTGFSPDFNGYYGAFAYLKLLAERFKDNFKIYIICGEESTLNLISLDWITYTTYELLKKPANNEIYHLTHDRPKSARWIIENTFNILGIEGVTYLSTKNLLKDQVYNGYILQLHQDNKSTIRVQKTANLILERYHPYVTFEEQFSLETVKNVLGPAFIEPPSTDIEFLQTILKYAVDHNFGHDTIKK